MKKPKQAPRYWKPLKRCPAELLHYSDELINHVKKIYDLETREEAITKLGAQDENVEVWVNYLYQVELRRYEGKMVQLNIRRVDGSCDLRDWRHFQEIKNQLVGPECEAIELYPAESRKVDTSNKWHLWCIDDPTFRFPVGWKQRDVQYHDGECAGLKQRPL